MHRREQSEIQENQKEKKKIDKQDYGQVAASDPSAFSLSHPAGPKK
jgi:hypothetical protein